jgi:hypothetical protein
LGEVFVIGRRKAAGFYDGYDFLGWDWIMLIFILLNQYQRNPELFTQRAIGLDFFVKHFVNPVKVLLVLFFCFNGL